MLKLEGKTMWTRWKYVAILAIVLLAMFICYGTYIELAKCTVPYSDYFQWTAAYGEKIVDSSLTWKDFFKSDSGVHIQPLAMFVTSQVLKLTNFDYSVLVTSGMVLRCVIALVLAMSFFLAFTRGKDNSPLRALVFAVLVAFVFLNFNQWEITTAPFSLCFSLRILIYFATFYIGDRWIQGVKNRKQWVNVIYGAVLGLGLSCVTVLVSAGYFVAHITAIGIVFVFVVIENAKDIKRYLLPLSVCGVTTLAGCILYLAMLYGARKTSISLTFRELELLLGIFLFWGRAVLPFDVSDAEFGSVPNAIMGTIVVLSMIFLVICYLKKGRRSRFPLYCLVYANIAAITIMMGRSNNFTYMTIMSSRYTIESTIGLVGVAWMLADCLVSKRGKQLRSISLVIAILLIAGLLYSAYAEGRKAPAIRHFYDDLEVELIDYDNCPDETLIQISANSPDVVRQSLAFLEEEHLSIFAKDSEEAIPVNK